MSRSCFKCFNSKSNVECESKNDSNKKLEQKKIYKSNEKGLIIKQISKNYPIFSKKVANVNMNNKKNQNKYSIESSEKNRDVSLSMDNLKYTKRGKSNIGFSSDEHSSNTDLKSIKLSKNNSQVNLYPTDYDEDMLNEILFEFNLSSDQILSIMNMPEENKKSIYKSYVFKYSEPSNNQESVEFFLEKMDLILGFLENQKLIENEEILDSLEKLKLELRNGTLR
jgi:hypothetical protein